MNIKKLMYIITGGLGFVSEILLRFLVFINSCLVICIAIFILKYEGVLVAAEYEWAANIAIGYMRIAQIMVILFFIGEFGYIFFNKKEEQ